MRSAKMLASEALARRSVAVMSKEAAGRAGVEGVTEKPRAG
jgi:hypothetical protein